MSDSDKEPKKDSPRYIASATSYTNKLGNIVSNDYHIYVLRKSEKLASALYVLTGFIPQDEPIRTKLRTCALDVVSQSSRSDTLSGKNVHHFGSRCTEIAAILETAKRAGLISTMNADLICDEYANLASFVRDNTDKLLEQSGELSDMHVVKPESDGKYKRHEVFNRTERIQGRVADSKNFNKGHTDRRQKIIDLFKNMNRISIKDAVSKIDGVSEKTVQRELLSLVEAGVLKKEGERRWSTYILVQTPSLNSVQEAVPSTHMSAGSEAT